MTAPAISVPFVSLDRQFRDLHEELLAAFNRVGNTGIYIMGPELERFEREAAAYCETKHAIGVANGTDALFLVLKALGVNAGDEVITCPNSFVATAGAIAMAGAKPTFADAGSDYNIDPAAVAAAVTPRTRAIIPVHLTGRPADMDAISEVAIPRGIAVIEDAAQAIGARYKGHRVGSLGTAGAFSLHPLKNLGLCGDAGLITTDNSSLYEAILKLRNHGLRNRDECEMWGVNSRLDALQAAFACVKLRHLDRWNERCREIAMKYRNGLNDVVWVPHDKPYEEAVYHNFVIRSELRDKLAEHLNRQGVGTRIHYPIPIHLQKPARELGHKVGNFPEAERQAATILSLPIYPELTAAEIARVIDAVRSFFDAGDRKI